VTTTYRSNAKAAVEARLAAWQSRLQAEVERMLGLLQSRADVERVVVFGSAARGAPRYHSDIDLVVVQRTPLPFLERVEAAYRLLRPRVPTDVLVYTPQEWSEMSARGGFGRRLRQEGRVLHARDAS
jgi:predicted nucleotidyltransferase